MLPYKKIHIIGSVGSGKTTLARNLSSEWGIPAFELDNLVWERHPDGDRRRNPEERDANLARIIEKEAWIIEGAHYHAWVDPVMRQADLIIFLDTPSFVRRYRIVTRFIRQMIGYEKANYKPSFEMLLDMFRWTAQFNREGRQKIVQGLRCFSDKVLILKNTNEMQKKLTFHRQRR
ncbi:DNA topology modulation protein FlaR [Sporolactobacillus laevolacticus]|uniref:DNA topology modulation protein FlaR n=1 Tax=Sporolactobacillus laevolacticus TaxID=33018 RepID=UPI0025B3BFA7|nr:DNA topology modulation protein FlaR [Sporolactobacillus laevolacticus]MDN3954657.1 DNA topology modulation protein FlaR [Sporolactobacillus laevolacticus]